MDARQVLATMIRTDRHDLTVWSHTEVRNALDAYREQVLKEEAAQVQARLDQATAELAAIKQQLNQLHPAR